MSFRGRRTSAPSSRARVRGCIGRTTGSRSARSASASSVPASSGASSTSAGRWSVTSTYAPGSSPSRLTGSPDRAAGSRRWSESIIVLPTTSIRSSGTPSASRLSRASALGHSSRSATRSVTVLLTSSGIVQSPDRRPASRWITPTPSFTAARAAAIVELTSPATRTASNRCSTSTASVPVSTAAVCSACEPEPTPRKKSGRGRSSCWRNDSDSIGS